MLPPMRIKARLLSGRSAVYYSSTPPSSSSSPPPPPPWASLPADILELILGFQTSFFDQRCFGAVCKSWRDAAATFNMGNPGRGGQYSLPIFTFCGPKEGGRRGGGEAEDPQRKGATDDEGGAITRYFYSLYDDKVYRLQVPNEFRRWRCIGSSHGWLAMLGNRRFNVFLFNPISGARVDLPSFATLSHSFATLRPNHRIESTYYPYWEGTYSYHFKLVLSSSPMDSDCIAMAVVTGYGLLACTRPGDDSWVEAEKLTGKEIFRDIMYHDRRFHALCHSGDILTIDFKGYSESLTGHNICNRLQPIVERITTSRHGPDFWSAGMYLATLPSGVIIYLARFVHRPRGDLSGRYRTFKFLIYKLDASSSRGNEWVKINCIGDCCLFLGHNQCMVLPASQLLGKYRTNCIYFTDDIRPLFYSKFYGHDFGMYDVEEGTTELVCHIDGQQILTPPVWITPSI